MICYIKENKFKKESPTQTVTLCLCVCVCNLWTSEDGVGNFDTLIFHGLMFVMFTVSLDCVCMLMFDN